MIKNYKKIFIPNIYLDYKCVSCGECCSHKWRIDIDKKSYTNVKNKIKENIDEYIESKDDAYICKFENDYCKLIDENKMCRIHKHLGWKYLSDTCKVYPRILKLSSRGMEISFVGSCKASAKKILSKNKFEIVEKNKEDYFFMPPENISFMIPENEPENSKSRDYFTVEKKILDMINSGDLSNSIIELIKISLDNFIFSKSVDIYQSSILLEILKIKEKTNIQSSREIINLIKTTALSEENTEVYIFREEDSKILNYFSFSKYKKNWNRELDYILKNYISVLIFSKLLYKNFQVGLLKILLLAFILKLKICLYIEINKRDLTENELVKIISDLDNDYRHSEIFWNSLVEKINLEETLKFNEVINFLKNFLLN